MPQRNGSQRFHSCKILVFLFSILLISSASSWAADQFLVVAPGQSYDGATDRTGTPNTQVAGEQFTMDVFCYDNILFTPRNSNLNATNLSSSAATEAFNPDPATLNETYVLIPNSRRSNITVTLNVPTTGNYSITAGASGGILADTIANLPVQRVANFVFTAIGPYTAGTPGTLTIEARDPSNNLCDAYNGSVNLYAWDGGVNGSTVNLGTVAFTNGVYTTNSLTLYHASPGVARIEIERVNSPTAQYSPQFTINPNTFTQLLTIGPGQSLRQGENGGNGRAGGSTTTSGQTAGSGFSLTVYACDAYWNTRTAASTVSLTCAEDPIFSYPGSAAFGGGSSVTFNPTILYTVGDGTLTVTASDGSATSSNDNVPLTASTLATFGINDLSGTKTAGVSFPLVITAFDSWGNTVSSVGGNTTFELLQVATPISSGNSAWSTSLPVTSANFSSGVYNGTMTINRAGANYDVRADNDSGGFSGPITTAHDFTVDVNTSLLRYLFIMPGETYRPGEDYIGGEFGHEGTPTDIVAGSFTSVSVYVTDLYGNRDTTYNNSMNVTLARTDGSAVLTNPVTITGGLGWENMILTTAYSGSNQQQLQSSGGTPLPLPSSLFNVLPNTLDHFSVGNIGATETAGVGFTTNISARDTYDNIVTTFAGPVYVTCPNLDYHDPEQSVIDIPTYGSVTGVTWTVNSGFSAGVWSHTIRVYRAGNPVTIFVADQPDGTGNTGVSAAFQVVPNVHGKVFMIVPGIEYRPGTGGGDGNSTGGYAGSPDAQQAGTPFNVTVYATDDWWNQIVSTGPFTMLSSPSTSNIHNTNWNFNSGNTIVSTILNDADSYQLTADYNIAGIDDYTTPYFISSLIINRFQITSPDGGGGGQLPNPVVAGVPFTISITAYADAGSTVATTFNGQANLITSADYEEPFRVISPQRITFTQGFWTGSITLYRSSPSITVSCELGTVPSNVPNNPTVVHAPADRMLLLATGMDEKPGIAPNTYPIGGFPGYTGNPAIQEAGESFDFRIHVCDEFYNVVTTTAEGGTDQIQITSSDPYPATMGTMGGDFQALPQTVRVGAYTVNSPQDPGYPAGAYRTTNFRLYTVGINGYQSISATNLDSGGVTSFTLGGGGVPPINVRHNDDVAQFQVDITTAAKTAGVAFASTITAQDAYGNTMDDRNGAAAFPPTNNVNLTAGSGTNTVYPYVVQLNSSDPGVGYPSLTLYKEYVGNSVTATYSDVNGTHGGTSAAMTVNSNTFARLIPSVPNMDVTNGGGRFTSPDPSNGFVGYSGSANVQTAGSAIGSFNVYACDLYGNISEGPTDLVYVKSTDRFAPLPRPVALNNISGQAAYNGVNSFAFHTAAESSQGDTPFTITAYDVLQTIQGVTRTASATDALGTVGVVDIIQIVNTATATAFIKNWDYRLVGDTIEWMTNAPSAGSLYQVYWVYSNPSGITSGTTPGIYVNPASIYGLISVAPGQVLVEGAGNSNMASGIGGVTPGGWYSGVTLTDPTYGVSQNVHTAYTEILGAAFSVTVVAADRFGNEVSSTETFQLLTNDNDPLSYPDVSTPLNGALVGGRALLDCALFNNGSQGNAAIWPVASTPALQHGSETRSDILLVSFGQTFFKVWVNGIESPGPVAVQASPEEFTVRVEIRDDISLQIVNTANLNFVLDAVTDPVLNTPGNGTLNVTFSNTEGGSRTITNQTYNVAETIYIRAREASGGVRPTAGYSPQVDVGASAIYRIVMTSDAQFVLTRPDGTPEYQILANEEQWVYARAEDFNQNPIAGSNLTFNIVEESLNAGAIKWDNNASTVAQPTITKPTDGTGTAAISFRAGARNETITIQAANNTVAATVIGNLLMGITVTQDGGVYPNPFNPLDPSQWANIDYRLDEPAKVNIDIYTLMGDLVWSQEFPAGSSEGSAGVRTIRWNGKNDVGVTVANGGYICSIKVNDREKYRFKIGVYKDR